MSQPVAELVSLAARLVAADAPELRAALAEAGLPTEDLTDPGRTFFCFEQDGAPVGYAGYELHGEHALVRSVVVLPRMRGRGFGRAIAEGVLERARAAGARQAYLLTTNAEDFFTHAGFIRVERSEAPPAILATKQASTICSTAPLMTRPIAPA